MKINYRYFPLNHRLSYLNSKFNLEYLINLITDDYLVTALLFESRSNSIGTFQIRKQLETSHMLLNTRYTHRLHYFYYLSVKIYHTVSFSGNFQAFTKSINIPSLKCFTYHTCCAPYWGWWCWWTVRDRPGGRRKTGSYNPQTRLGNGIPVHTSIGWFRSREDKMKELDGLSLFFLHR